MRTWGVVVATLLALLSAGCPDGDGPIATPTPPAELTEITMEMSISSVPHSAESCRTDCLSCHATGRDGAPPQAHPGRTECLLCHVVVNPSDQ